MNNNNNNNDVRARVFEKTETKIESVYTLQARNEPSADVSRSGL